MAKNKQRKKKERERRVAQKKLAATKKRAQETVTQEPAKTHLKRNKLAALVPVPKNDYATINPKTPFIRRRSDSS